MTPRGWLLVLSAYLLVWQPMRFAAEVTASLPSLDMRGAPGMLELTAHAFVTALAAAAGWALWIVNPRAPSLTAIALVATAAATVQSLYWTRLPENTIPGDRLPLAVLTVLHNGGWIAYLRRSRRVHSLYS